MHDPLTAIVKDGKFLWLGQSKEVLVEYLRKLEGKTVSVMIDDVEPKTQNQLGYYYGVCLPLIRSFLIENGHDVMGVPATIEYTDYIVKHFCARLDGKKITLKRNMSKDKASQFITNVIQWAGTLSVYIPPPPHDDLRPITLLVDG
jgi:hypothetical protein